MLTLWIELQVYQPRPMRPDPMRSVNRGDRVNRRRQGRCGPEAMRSAAEVMRCAQSCGRARGNEVGGGGEGSGCWASGCHGGEKEACDAEREVRWAWRYALAGRKVCVRGQPTRRAPSRRGGCAGRARCEGGGDGGLERTGGKVKIAYVWARMPSTHTPRSLNAWLGVRAVGGDRVRDTGRSGWVVCREPAVQRRSGRSSRARAGGSSGLKWKPIAPG